MAGPIQELVVRFATGHLSRRLARRWGGVAGIAASAVATVLLDRELRERLLETARQVVDRARRRPATMPQRSEPPLESRDHG